MHNGFVTTALSMTVLFEEGFRYLVEVARCEGVETALYHQIEEVGVVNALRVSGFGFRVSGL